jgi:hypothetical protein
VQSGLVRRALPTLVLYPQRCKFYHDTILEKERETYVDCIPSIIVCNQHIIIIKLTMLSTTLFGFYRLILFLYLKHLIQRLSFCIFPKVVFEFFSSLLCAIQHSSQFPYTVIKIICHFKFANL